MRNNIESREVTVLLVSDNESDIQEVKTHLEKTMGISCHLWHCPSVLRSTGFFKKEIPGIDIVLLDLGLVTSGQPHEIFRQMQDIVGGIPIIVFTERENHGLALLVIDEGAADNVTRGQFSTDPYKLRDAIEFSLSRHKISEKIRQKNATDYKHLEERSASDIQDMKDHETIALKEGWAEAGLILEDAIEHGKDDLREANKHAGIVLEEAIEHGAKNLREAKAEAATALKQAHEESAVRHREKDQVISWMGGGYSVETTSSAIRDSRD